MPRGAKRKEEAYDHSYLDHITKVITKYGKTHKEIAKKMGISYAAYMCRFMRVPTRKTRESIAKILGCDITELYLPNEDTSYIRPARTRRSGVQISMKVDPAIRAKCWQLRGVGVNIPDLFECAVEAEYLVRFGEQPEED